MVDNNHHDREESAECERCVADLLGDEEARSLLIQKLKESGHVEDVVPSSKSSTSNTPSNSGGPWPTFPLQYPFAALPFWGPITLLPWVASTSNPHSLPGSTWTLGQPGSSCTQGQEEEGDKNVVEFLDDAEALELVQFDHSVQDDSVWEAGETVNFFLEKHFLHPLPPEEREAIMKDFPKPACSALCVPKLDEEIKEQIKKVGKNPHFVSEKFLFKFQEQMLEITGPLTFLWADMLNHRLQ